MWYAIKDVILSYDFTIVYRIFLGAILCGIIGLERQSWNKPAGFKTHIIIGLSSVLVMLIGQYISTQYESAVVDPTRLPSQLLAGIGFIGAGAILRDGFKVKGLNTASSILGVTCIGLAVGAGFYLAAIVVTLILYLVLSYSHLLVDVVIKYTHMYVIIKAKYITRESIATLRELFEKQGVKINYLSYKKDNNYIKVKGKYQADTDINDLISVIANLEFVNEVIQELREE